MRMAMKEEAQVLGSGQCAVAQPVRAFIFLAAFQRYSPALTLDARPRFMRKRLFLGWPRFVGTALAALLVFAFPAASQVAPPAQQQSSQAVQLPLSGRAAAQSNGTVKATESPIAGVTTSVNTLNSTVQVQGAYAGSIPGIVQMPFSGKLGFREAILRALAYNLGQTGATQALRQAEGQARSSRSALLPNISGTALANVETEDLRALGFRFSFPGFSIPAVIGPFNYVDFRAHLSQTIVDFTALNNYRAMADVTRGSRYSAQDARDLIVLAVGGAYLQVTAAKARLKAEQAQVTAANAVYQQSVQQLAEGIIAKVDADKNEVQVLTEQQRLLSLQNDFAKQKINLARMIGLPPNDQYEVTDEIPYSPALPITLEDALNQAFDQRADLKAADAQVRAAERARAAARAERYPSLSANADVGGIGVAAGQLQTTYTATANLKIPIWPGGRIGADVEQADAALAQRRAEFEDLRGQIESDVRSAFLDLRAASSQVEVAQKNVQVAQEAAELTHQKLEAGVSTTVDYAQAQQVATSAEFDYINAVFAHNIAKLSLARAMGRAAAALPQFLKLP
jgi:outer membrane protein TolC